MFKYGDIVAFLDVDHETKLGHVIHATNTKAIVFPHKQPNSRRVLEIPTKALGLAGNPISAQAKDVIERERFVAGEIVIIKQSDGNQLGVCIKRSIKGTQVFHPEDNGVYQYPFNYQVEKAQQADLIFDPANALNDWSAVSSNSRTPHHDGGQCEQFIVSFQGKKVLRVTEDDLGGEDTVEELTKDGNYTAKLAADALTAFKQLGISESNFHFASSALCMANWLALNRGIQTLTATYA